MIGARLESLLITDIHGSARSLRRKRSTLSHAESHSYHLLVDCRESWTLSWRGTNIRLGPGDLVMTDSRFVHSANHGGGTHGVSILIPPHWARLWLRDPERLAGRRIPGDVGWGRALSTFALLLTPEWASQSPLPSKLLTDNFGSLLSLVENDVLALPPLHAIKAVQLKALIREAIRQRASECGLTAMEVAQSLDIPERTLHQTLLSERETFATLLYQARMELAQRMLESKRFMRLTTAEIGRRAGFADPAYFVRAAVRKLGMTPARYRKAVHL